MSEQVSEYDKLMKSFDDILLKAQGADEDAKIKAAAGDHDEPDEDDMDGADASTDDGDADNMMKSFQVTLEDGSSVEAYNATDMLKAMHGVAKRHGEQLAEMTARAKAADAVLAKVPEILSSLQTTIARQGEMLKALSQQPAGRKSVVQAPSEAAPKTKSAPQIMAKALELSGSGTLSSADVAIVENRLAKGMSLPSHLAALLGND